MKSLKIPENHWLSAPTAPELTFEQDRWSKTRTLNVEEIATTWHNNPNLVRIFADPKFGHMQMALLRKDQLESLIKVLRDIQNGQAAIKYDVQAIFQTVDLIKDVLKNHEIKEEETSLYKAVNVFVTLWSKISSTVLIRAPIKKVKPSPLSTEEMGSADE